MTSTHSSAAGSIAQGLVSRCTIVPPYILEALATSGEPAVARHAREALRHDEQLRAARRTPTARPTGRRAPRREDAPKAHGTGPHRTIFDAKGTQTTPGTRVRAEGAAPTGDVDRKSTRLNSSHT